MSTLIINLLNGSILIIPASAIMWIAITQQQSEQGTLDIVTFYFNQLQYVSLEYTGTLEESIPFKLVLVKGTDLSQLEYDKLKLSLTAVTPASSPAQITVMQDTATVLHE